MNMELDRIIYFIHIPKTAGTALKSQQIIKPSVTHAFNVPGLYRIPASERGYELYKTSVMDMYSFPLKPNHKISIIRNPFDLLSSYYLHGDPLNDNEYSHSGWAAVNYTHKFKSFKEFIASYCDPNFKWHIPALKNFLFSQLFDGEHRCCADIIVRYEYLDTAIDILNRKLKHPIIKRRRNVTSRKTKRYQDYYDNEMIELVNGKCERELEHFGYSFDGPTCVDPLIINYELKYDVHSNMIL